MSAGAAQGVVDAVAALSAEVFAGVDRLRGCAHALFAPGAPVARRDLAPLEEPVRATLGAVGGAVVGAGVVAAPNALCDPAHWVEWWTAGPVREGHQAVRLVVETDADADGFRDYTLLPWFEVPSRTGLPHVTGPYVDYLCTDEYTLTFTAPVLTGSGTVGVVGADVPARHLERLLAPALGQVGLPAAVVNAQGRVVAGNRPDLTTGTLLRERGPVPGASTPVAGTPLAVVLVA